MSEFINTIDVLGDDAVTDSIINRSVTEFKDDKISIVGTGAFQNCSALKTVDLPSATSIGTVAFSSCTALETADLSSTTKIDSNALLNCPALKTVDLSSATSISTYAFKGCNALETVDLPSATSIGAYAFENCSMLETLILRNTSAVCTLGSNDAFSNTPIKSGTGYIYVPSALVDSYKAATNWSTYASQFRALENYTVDGTITGELDPNKI